MKIPKDLRKVAKQAKEQGFEITQTKNGHTRWTSPDGGSATHSGSPGDHRANKNFLQQLKRAGFEDS